MSLQQTYKRSLSGSVGAGIGSIFNASGKTYFILEHKVSSKYHKAGENQEIIVDQIEIGRDSRCQVQFDDSFKTVSRRHAAIVRDGDNWKLIQLSQTNQTFLNGRSISNEWYLQNGDEIQLSVNGPRLGFIIPTGNKSKTGSIALSRRLSLFRQQALKPYKTMMIVLSALLFLFIAGGISWGVYDYQKDLQTASYYQKLIDDLGKRAADAEKENDRIRQKLDSMSNELKVTNKKVNKFNRLSDTKNKSIEECKQYVYYINTEVYFETGVSRKYITGCTGTGFLLNDGRFVTARHCVEPWMFHISEMDRLANYLDNNKSHEGSVVAYIDAYSSTGDKMSFVSTQAHINRSKDVRGKHEKGLYISKAEPSLDYAYFITNKKNKNGLSYDNQKSLNLPLQTHLTVLGFPRGLGKDSDSSLHPMYGEANVARDGIDNGEKYKGMILTTATTFEPGNSGGPVFITKDGELTVIGVVSFVSGRSLGGVVPIATVK